MVLLAEVRTSARGPAQADTKTAANEREQAFLNTGFSSFSRTNRSKNFEDASYSTDTGCASGTLMRSLFAGQDHWTSDYGFRAQVVEYSKVLFIAILRNKE
jgi:hypothetical protein